MQNDDEELRGLEEKLSRLKPRDLDERYLRQLKRSLVNPSDEEAGALQDEVVYPTNVVWMRFAPVAAAAAVVLLGTFLIRNEIGGGSSANSPVGAMAENEGNGGKNGVSDAMVSSQANGETNRIPSELADPGASQWRALPVPRLGMDERYTGGGSNAFDPSVLPVSAQGYLLPLDGTLGDFYQLEQKNGGALGAGLHFEEAYDWQEGQEDPEATKATNSKARQ